jgi:hypothetical protein
MANRLLLQVCLWTRSISFANIVYPNTTMNERRTDTKRADKLASLNQLASTFASGGPSTCAHPSFLDLRD